MIAATHNIRMPATTLTLSSLPLFPLGTVLFPGGVLPLRIFEVRYLDMVRKCHAAGAPFGVVALTTGSEVRQAGAAPETFEAVGTLATILHLDATQPSLLTVQCAGQQRFRITRRERLVNGLWITDVQAIADDTAVAIPPDLLVTAQMLAHLLPTLRDRGDPAHAGPAPTAAQLADCGWVANRWCELLPLPLAHKQQLLELDNPLIRLELVGDFLAQSGIAR